MSDRVIGLCGGWYVLHANDFELQPRCSGETQFREVKPRNDVDCTFFLWQDTRQLAQLLLQFVVIGLRGASYHVNQSKPQARYPNVVTFPTPKRRNDFCSFSCFCLALLCALVADGPEI